jgi:pyruvate kinase
MRKVRHNPRKTKIICTLGPSTEEVQKIQALIAAGMNVARLNFSHGSHKLHRKMIQTIREISKKMGKEVAILGEPPCDLPLPRMETGEEAAEWALATARAGRGS